ncbi:MAG: hypothetical protein FRX48_04327 [Lasallia pustulata]|uniref:Malate dehydrogenase n=1 Tax=Lasallia pustulata TaxID=136370 RepID=A0A1W5D603_9LECA|nr:MAG: hypothetical protein FRX48_04327 [Lasallia pustulata]SLM38557.1 Protein of unknown function DUF3455 [Lasallia pustulata]
MHYELLLVAALSSLAASASIASRENHDWPAPVRDYYSAVGKRVAAVKKTDNNLTPPACDLASAVPPAAPTPLPAPSPGLAVYHVAIGRGTQNYTCASNSSAAPVLIGARASLYNASCIAALYPDVLATLPAAALAYPVPTSSNPLAPSNLLLSGHHYFSDPTTPTFNLVTSNGDFGVTYSKKKAASAAPTVTTSNIVGYGNVPWLQLQAVVEEGSEGVVQEVYRLNTAGGAAPPTCAGQQGAFQVEYAAEYWFYA